MVSAPNPQYLKRDLADQHFPPRPKVAKKTEPGIGEGGRLVMFKDEMPDPGESIALH